MDFHTGQQFTERFVLDEEVVRRFAAFSGDVNPLHMDAAEARSYGFPQAVAHGAIQVAYLSRMIGMVVPGAGALWTGHSLQWLKPVYVGDEIELKVEVRSWSAGAGLLQLQFYASNTKGEHVMKGEAEVKVGHKLNSVAPAGPGGQRVALVTGASGGIGAATALALSGNGPVAVHYHANAAGAEAVVKQIIDAGGRAQAFQADLSKTGAAEQLVQAVVVEFGQLDVLVHGATASLTPVALKDSDAAYFDIFWRVQVAASQDLLKVMIPLMGARKHGRCIFLGTSYLFGQPPAGLAHYVAAKQALWGMVRSASIELGPLGITVNMISPSMTVTGFSAHVPQRVREVEAMKNACRRLATPEDSAAAVAWLASDAASFVNGVNLPVTGGPVM
ncbi:MAG: SDR family oxidoreductase [Verrucomicrobia bacterium]|nr:SDR family oxidoreductase [Verrucomicrobiota bacterium]